MNRKLIPAHEIIAGDLIYVGGILHSVFSTFQIKSDGFINIRTHGRTSALDSDFMDHKLYPDDEVWVPTTNGIADQELITLYNIIESECQNRGIML